MKALTKARLVELLEFADDDDEVFILAQSGDYWRTELALPVREVSDGTVTWSEYNRAYKLPREGSLDDDGDDGDDEHPNKYVILIGS